MGWSALWTAGEGRWPDGQADTERCPGSRLPVVAVDIVDRRLRLGRQSNVYRFESGRVVRHRRRPTGRRKTVSSLPGAAGVPGRRIGQSDRIWGVGRYDRPSAPRRIEKVAGRAKLASAARGGKGGPPGC